MNTTEKIGWALCTVAIAVILGCFIFAFKGDIKTVAGAITSPAGQADYMNFTQAIGFGPNAQTIGSQSTNIMGVRSASASSTYACTMQNPFNATSSLINTSFQPVTSIAVATSLGLYTGATAGATTTGITTSLENIASGATTGLYSDGIASSTGLGTPIAPNAYVTWAQGAGQFVGFTGACNALFESAN